MGWWTADRKRSRAEEEDSGGRKTGPGDPLDRLGLVYITHLIGLYGQREPGALSLGSSCLEAWRPLNLCPGCPGAYGHRNRLDR